MTQNFNIPLGQFGVLYCDPPWLFKNYSEAGEGKNANQHYDCMTLEEMIAMRESILWACGHNCVCVMWAMECLLPEAMELMKAWGFTYKTCGWWNKKTVHGKNSFGKGYILRNAGEPYLIGTMGSPRIKNHRTRNAFDAPLREHSRKPDEIIPMIEALFDGPYLELFSRTERPGWTVWGNQTGLFKPETKEA